VIHTFERIAYPDLKADQAVGLVSVIGQRVPGQHHHARRRGRQDTTTMPVSSSQ
jgi:hypothetical protein